MPDLNKPFSLLAFDFGLKQIGVAYGQTLTNSAKGIAIIKAVDGVPQWSEVGAVIELWTPNIALVGLPINMDGSESVLSGRARKFALISMCRWSMRDSPAEKQNHLYENYQKGSKEEVTI